MPKGLFFGLYSANLANLKGITVGSGEVRVPVDKGNAWNNKDKYDQIGQSEGSRNRDGVLDLAAHFVTN